MSDRLGLNSRFQTGGVFWDSRSPDQKFAAHLSSSSTIELITCAVSAEPKSFVPDASDNQPPDIVHGLTTLGPCTLFGLHALNPRGWLDTRVSAEGVLVPRFRITNCIIGCHLQSDVASVIESAWASYSGIHKWLPPSAEISETQDYVSLSYPRKPLSFIDLCILSSRTRLSVSTGSRVEYDERKASARSEGRVVVEPQQPQSLEWYFDVFRRFENFFSLCLGTSVRFKSLSFTTQSGETAWLVRRRHLKAEQPDLQQWIKCESSQVAAAIATWFDLPDRLRSLENLIYGTLRSSSLFPETKFLSLAQALESLHRLTDSNTVVASDSFKEMLKFLKEQVANRCGGSSISERLIRSLQFANEPTFQERIKALLTRVTLPNNLKLLDDPEEFEQTLRQTRNHFTHLGIQERKRVLSDPKSLFLFNQRLTALLRLLMLLSIGFEERSVFDPIYYQSRKWR